MAQYSQEGGCEPLCAWQLPLAAPDLPSPSCSEPWEVNFREPVSRLPHLLVSRWFQPLWGGQQEWSGEKGHIGVSFPNFLPLTSPLAPESLNHRFQPQSRSFSPRSSLLLGPSTAPLFTRSSLGWWQSLRSWVLAQYPTHTFVNKPLSNLTLDHMVWICHLFVVGTLVW